MKPKKFFLWILFLLSVGVTMCKKDETVVVEEEEVVNPIADFTYELSPDDPQKVTFISKSEKYNSLYWQLGDDSLSTDETVVHTYKTFGKFRVILTARNEQGYSAKKEVSIYLRNPVFNPDSVGENYIRTKGGLLTVFRDNDAGAFGGEGSNKLVNGNPFDKFFAGYEPARGTWWKFQFAEPIVAQAYTLVSTFDFPFRDPISWTFEGSNDDQNWTVLDTQADSKWPINPANGAEWRSKQRIFHITSNQNAYTYYRLNITKNNGAPGGIHLAEWTINASQP